MNEEVEGFPPVCRVDLGFQLVQSLLLTLQHVEPPQLKVGIKSHSLTSQRGCPSPESSSSATGYPLLELEILREGVYKLDNKKYEYPPFLGLSEFIADTRHIAYLGKKHILRKESAEPVEISTVCNASKIVKEGLDFKTDNDKPLQYIQEKMPLEFGKGREIKYKTNFVYEKNQQKIRAKLKEPFYEITYYEDGSTITEKIIFMEQ